VTTKFKWKGFTVLLGMFQHRLHTGRVVRKLERLNSEHGEWGIELYPLALRDYIISFVLPSTVPPHCDNPTFVIPLNIHAIRIIGDVDRMNRVRNRNGDLNFRSSVRIRCPNKTFLMDGLIDRSHGVTNVRRATVVIMYLTPGISPSARRAGHW